VADNEKLSVTFHNEYMLSEESLEKPGPILSRANKLQITFQTSDSDYRRGFLSTFQSSKEFKID